ncbi:uncharacterized protein EDB91DRAFT_1236219 [Suillus paluster]|uniref:uncharacterized protein n=1 Tax=Suillus paluster TaxID=48578 RepID=UPI001B869153|nr:uncharacterized protein EDB91DRAFT_1236219 [Suillus paluster]KAG1745910.1 hypothetical protein EDB91DRAFT_1236219 [Suillus paluster]
MTSFTTFLLTLLALFSLSFSAPILRRDVFVPPILYPRSDTVWIAGQHHNVTWSTDNAPVNITNSIGQGFDILDGRVEIQVPYVTTGSNYSLVLFGDSGNYSPEFTILSQ